MAIVNIGDTESFAYTGGVQQFTIPVNGLYKLIAVGASGGTRTTYSPCYCYGGAGGKTVQYVQLKKGTIVYICVGGAGGGAGGSSWGGAFTAGGGYNGGGSASTSRSDGGNTHITGGGGATHFALMTGVLSSLANDKDKILAVAGGGSGAGPSYAYGSSYNGSQYGAVGGGTSGGNYQFGVGVSKGGGGYVGGNGSVGGTGYVSNPSIVFNNITYSSTTTNGSGYACVHGSASITLVDTSSAVAAYLGDTLLEGIKIGNIDISSIL